MRCDRTFALALLLFVWVSGCAAVAAPPAAGAAKEATGEAPLLRVAILGDRTGLARPGVFEAAVERVEQMRPDLVLMVGDLIEGYTSTPTAIDREWADAEAMLSPLRMPFVLAPGNHDIGNTQMERIWRERRGPLWTSFVRQNILFLVLDSDDPPLPMPPKMEAGFRQMAARMQTDPFGAAAAIAASPRPSDADLDALKHIEQARIGAAQLEFVRQTLSAHKDVRWTVVVVHKPAWHEPASGFREIEALLADRPYTVIAGHLHQFSHERRFGRDYIIMGPTGALPPHDRPDERDRIGWLTFGSGAPTFVTLDLQGISLLDRGSGRPDAH